MPRKEKDSLVITGLFVVSALVIGFIPLGSMYIHKARMDAGAQEIQEIVAAISRVNDDHGNLHILSFDSRSDNFKKLVEDGYLTGYTNGVGENVFGKDISVYKSNSRYTNIRYTLKSHEDCQEMKLRAKDIKWRKGNYAWAPRKDEPRRNPWCWGADILFNLH